MAPAASRSLAPRLLGRRSGSFLCRQSATRAPAARRPGRALFRVRGPRRPAVLVEPKRLLRFSWSLLMGHLRAEVGFEREAAGRPQRVAARVQFGDSLGALSLSAPPVFPGL